MNILLLFPNQIFEKKYIDDVINSYKINKIVLLEHPIFFGLDNKRKINFNKMKLVLHRASFYFYKEYLKNFIITEHISIYKFDTFKINKEDKVYYLDVPDYLLDIRLRESFKNIKRIDDIYPSYIFSRKELESYLTEKKGKKKRGYFHKQFYEWGRKKRDILMDNGKPLGGKFSYDTYNRNPPPKNLNSITNLPKITQIDKIYIEKAKKEIEEEFPNNYGNSNLYIPVSFDGAKKWLEDFIKYRLNNFGIYQDAVLKEDPFMNHSIISPMLNCGLLTPNYVLSKIIEYYNSNTKVDVLYSVEGFVRQILGWREWQRFIYLKRYKESISSNYYENNRQLSIHWYNGTLGVEPIDDTIKSGYKNAYLHHILRLMYMSNFMTLCRIHPDEMYYWFMSFSMDSYDWVMIQNVYGMGSFADGGNTTTKPYITTGNYIIRMSNYKKGEWAKLWEALYYIFILDNLDKLIKFPRVGGIMRKNLERKSDSQLLEYEEIVNNFFKKIN